MKTIIALVGKAGSGKDTILQKLCSRNKDYNMIVSCTTRPKRQGEVEGYNYYFLNNSQFDEKVKNGDMLEHTEFNGWKYGTSLNGLQNGVNIGVFNPEGYYKIRHNKNINVIGYYVMASDKTRLLRQLNREDDPNVKEIIRRYSADEADFTNLEWSIEFRVMNEVAPHILNIVQQIECTIHDLDLNG